MGGKSRKTGGVSRKLIEKLKNIKNERESVKTPAKKGNKNGLGISTK